MRPRSVVIVTPPVVEPITLREVREDRRLSADQTDDDRLLLGLMATARRHIEKRLGIALVATQYRATFNWGAGRLELPSPPVLIDEDHPITVTAGGVAVSASDYTVDTDSRPAILELTVPTAEDVVVTYWAGVAPGEPIEPGLRSCLLLLVGHLYANREATTAEGIGELPMGLEMLLAAESVLGTY